MAMAAQRNTSITLKCSHCHSSFHPWVGRENSSIVCSLECHGLRRSKLAAAEAVTRFMDRVRKTSSCWIWAGSKGNGYGAIFVDGKKQSAHRFSYETHKGPAGDLFVCHSCDNPRCVNPKHLWLGTNEENFADMRSKKRGSKPPLLDGTKHPKSKLTEAQVRAIRRSNASGKLLAAKYGVSDTLIYGIRSGKNWRHLRDSRASTSSKT